MALPGLAIQMLFAGCGMLAPKHRCHLPVGIAQPDEMSDRAMSMIPNAEIVEVLLRWRLVVCPASS
jgi:hypothetical protein